MDKSECIILVPGLFGFAKIGNIDYFAQVATLLSKATGIDDIAALETPPTGPLWRRVDTLHRCVLEKLAQGVGTIHLLGHSTGGVDVRLLSNGRYLWPGGPSGDDRTSWFGCVGSVVSVSAPQKGTPVATRLRGTLEDTIPVLFLVSLLAKAHSSEGSVWKDIRERLGKFEIYLRLAQTISGRSTPRLSLKALATAADATAEQARAFLQQIVDDHPLIHELTPGAMARLNEKLQVQDGGIELPVSSFVTVAPPPALRLRDFRIAHAMEPARRAFYAASYQATHFEPYSFGSLPMGPWIGMPEGLETFSAVAQDGVVPAASQTLDGRAAALVYGDHLDVVGHYPGARHGGETVFDSGANFDDQRMEELWNAVGAIIAKQRGAARRTAA